MVPSRISTLNTEISLISCGGEHSVAIDDCNVYVWGSSRRGQLGIQSSSEKERLTPIRMDKLSGHKFIKIECGYFFTVALTTDGLYLWGDLMNSKEEIVYSPVKVQIDFIRISQLSCGYSHVAILTTNGEVWTFGNGSYGQLGHEDLSNQENPKLVESLCGKNIRSISCGSLHTVAVTDLGNVSTWGSSHKGCLGYPSTSPHQVSPKLVSGLRGKNIIQAFAGHTHTIVTTENDEVYVWGEFKNLMELSVNNTDEDAPRRTQSFSGEAPADNSDLPMVIPELYAKQIKQLECGDQFTIFLSADQTLYSWGSGQFGQLGHGDILDFTVPTLIETTNESEILQKLQVENTFVHEDQGEFNEKFLLETLQIQQSYYRPHVMLSRAKQWKNWNAVSTIYETQGKWDGAISARLMQIKIHYGKSIDTLVSSTLALLQHLKDELFGKLALSINNKDELLYPVLEFWKENKLPMAPLSKFVCSNLDVLAPILGEILKNNKAPNPFCVNFDLKVYVHITKKCMETTRNAYLHGSQDKPPEDRMWTQIKNNIAKDLDKKDKILLDPEHVPRSAHEKDFMFTCGHSFTREKFYSEIIPTFEDKTQQFSHPLPITTRLMVMDYQQHQISLSCPVCAYNELRKNQKTIHKKWEL
uniref:RCC1-like domain-containing protein n=1 Tax=Arcella intermedia TaxID=1963864 RepID=A0A6B2KZA5_9EUKA